MNERFVAVVILSFALVISLSSFGSVTQQAWGLINSWTMLSLAGSALTAFGVLLIAFWVCRDYEASDSELVRLQKRIRELEDVVDNNFKFIDGRWIPSARRKSR